MSFFQLTSLGPENFIQSTLINCGCYTLYFDSDYEKAYNNIIKSKGKFYLKDMNLLLEIIMGFAPLKEELDLFYFFSKKNLEDELSFEELINILNNIRNYLNERATKAKNYKSFEKYYFDHYHHRTASSDPNVAFRSPATKGMNYGFYEFDNNINDVKVNNIYKPLRKCPETKYAEELIKSKYISYK